jgi:hypothetical protein
VTFRAPASSEFSTSSFTTLAGRSTTSPAAIWLATCSGRRRIRFTAFVEKIQPRINPARRSRNQSSAELYSAVSRICHPPAVARPDDPTAHGTQPNTIRRDSRLQICATPKRAAGKKSAHEDKIFTNGNTDKIFISPLNYLLSALANLLLQFLEPFV